MAAGSVFFSSASSARIFDSDSRVSPGRTVSSLRAAPRNGPFGSVRSFSSLASGLFATSGASSAFWTSSASPPASHFASAVSGASAVDPDFLAMS